MLGSPSLRLELEQQTRLDDRVFPSEWWRERDHAPECSEPIARGIRQRPSPQLSRPPRPVVASCLGTTTGGQNGPPWARRQRRARQIHLVPLLPGVGLIGLLRRWGIDRIMQPPVPVRRHLRRLGLFGIDDPASRSSKRANALGLLKIAVTELVGADESAAQPRIDSVAPGVAAPPAEDLAHDAHKRAARRPRLPDSLCPLKARPLRCPVDPTPRHNGHTCGIWNRLSLPLSAAGKRVEELSTAPLGRLQNRGDRALVTALRPATHKFSTAIPGFTRCSATLIHRPQHLDASREST